MRAPMVFHIFTYILTECYIERNTQKKVVVFYLQFLSIPIKVACTFWRAVDLDAIL